MKKYLNLILLIVILVYEPGRHFPCDPDEPIPRQTVVKVPGGFYARFEESVPKETCIWTQLQYWCEWWSEHPENGGRIIGRVVAQEKSIGDSNWNCEGMTFE